MQQDSAVAAPDLTPHPIIRGTDVGLRPTIADDLDLLASWFTRPDVVKYWGDEPLSRDEVAEKYVGRRRPAVECFVVQTGTTPVGLIQYWVDDHHDNRGGIDMVLLEEHRRHGLGRAAAHALVTFLLDTLHWSSITVDPDDWNGDAKAFWTAVGFEPIRLVADEPGRVPYVLMRWPGD